MPTLKDLPRAPTPAPVTFQPDAARFEPQIYHDPSIAGYVVLRTRNEAGSLAEFWSSPAALASLLTANASAQIESWISAAQFYERKRSPGKVSRFPVCWLRLDVRKVRSLAASSPEQLAKKILKRCRVKGVPSPTLIVRSTVVELKWVLQTPAPSIARPRWEAVQKELARKFAKFGADLSTAADACVLFKVVGSRDGETGDVVQILHCGTEANAFGAEMSNGFVVYDFDAFAAVVLPYTREQVQEYRREQANRINARPGLIAEVVEEAPACSSGPAGAPWNRTERSLALARLHDLRVIWHLRGWRESAESLEQRDKALFYAAVCVAQLVDIAELHHEIAKLVRELAPGFSAEQIEKCTGSAIERAKNVASGRGPAQFRFKTAYIIDQLKITPEEQRQLSHLFGREEKLRRKAEREAERRREKGVMTLAAKTAVAVERRKRAKERRAARESWPRIAAALQYPSPDAARMDCQRG